MTERRTFMHVAAAQITIFAPLSHSLKDKRRVVRSLTDQIKNRFNVAVAEVDAMDLHQSIVIGFACVSASWSHAQEQLDAVIRFSEDLVEAAGAQVISIDQEN